MDAPPRFARWRTDAAIVALALALAAVSVAVGFCTDDYGFRALIRARPHAFIDMFRFASGEPQVNLARIAAGRLPWWTAPDFRLHLVRPLTGALFAADVAIFGEATLGYHLHSLAWYAALLAGAAAFFRRLLPRPAASFALAVFGLRAAHVLPYAWIAARHLVVGGALAAWALVVHLGPADRTARASRRRRLLPGGAPLLFVLALAASEAALGGIALAVAIDAACVGSVGSVGSVTSAERRSWKRFVARVAPLLAVALVYVVLYRFVGGGARASGDYHDPIADPIGFLRVVVVRAPVLLADALLGIPVVLATKHATLLASVGAAAMVALGALLATAAARRVLSPRVALAFAVGAVAGVVVGASGTLGSRVLLVPDLGFAALIGALLAAAFAGERSAAGGGRVAVLIAGCVLAFAHLAVAPVATLFEIGGLRHLARVTDAIALGAEIPPGARRDVFIVAASDPYVFLYPRAILADRAPGKVGCWSVLSSARADHQVARIDDRSLRVRSEGLPMLTGFDALFRSPSERPFVAGDEVQQCGATIRVEAVDAGRPTSVVVTFATSIDDAPDDDGPVLLMWDGMTLRRFAAPPPASPPVEIAWERGPRERR